MFIHLQIIIVATLLCLFSLASPQPMEHAGSPRLSSRKSRRTRRDRSDEIELDRTSEPSTALSLALHSSAGEEQEFYQATPSIPTPGPEPQFDQDFQQGLTEEEEAMMPIIAQEATKFAHKYNSSLHEWTVGQCNDFIDHMARKFYVPQRHMITFFRVVVHLDGRTLDAILPGRRGRRDERSKQLQRQLQVISDQEKRFFMRNPKQELTYARNFNLTAAEKAQIAQEMKSLGINLKQIATCEEPGKCEELTRPYLLYGDDPMIDGPTLQLLYRYLRQAMGKSDLFLSAMDAHREMAYNYNNEFDDEFWIQFYEKAKGRRKRNRHIYLADYGSPSTVGPAYLPQFPQTSDYSNYVDAAHGSDYATHHAQMELQQQRWLAEEQRREPLRPRAAHGEGQGREPHHPTHHDDQTETFQTQPQFGGSRSAFHRWNDVD